MTFPTDVIVVAYVKTLGELWKEAQAYVEQIAKGAKIQDAAALDIYQRHMILRRNVVERQFPSLVVLPWVPPVPSEFLHPEDLGLLQQDIDRLRIALRSLLSN